MIPGGVTEAENALAAIGAGRAQPSVLATPLTIGPALWALLVKLDPALAEAGTKSSSAASAQDRASGRTLDIRSFIHADPQAGDAAAIERLTEIGQAFARRTFARERRRAQDRLST